MEYTPKEISEELAKVGISLTERSILRYIDKGRIKSVKVMNAKGVEVNKVDDKEYRRFLKDYTNKQKRLVGDMSYMSGSRTAIGGDANQGNNKTKIDPTERLVEYLEGQVGELSKKNEELQEKVMMASNQSGLWQGRASQLEEQLKLLSAGSTKTDQTDDNISDIEVSKTDSQKEAQKDQDNETDSTKYLFGYKNSLWVIVGVSALLLALLVLLLTGVIRL